MATLHQITEETQILIKWLIIFIIGMIFLAIIVRFAGMLKEKYFPLPSTPPTVQFGKLPPLSFPTDTHTILQYSINTLTGSLPSFPDKLAIYEIHQPQPNLLALQKTQEVLDKTDFQGIMPTKLSESLYKWDLLLPPIKSLTFNILSGDFTITSDYMTDSTVLAGTNLDRQKALEKAQLFSFLFPVEDLDLNKTKTTFFDITNGVLSPITSTANTKIMRIDFFQKNVNELPIYYTKPTSSSMNFLIGSGDSEPQIIEAHFLHKTVNDSNATYPLKNAQEAFIDLQKGNAYIVSSSTPKSTIAINDVFLAYYMSDDPQAYLMPIIVFQGNDGFYAYVSAIKDEWVQK